MVRQNADVPDDLRKRLLHALVDDDLSFRRWLIRAIERYLEEREPKRRKGKMVRP